MRQLRARVAGVLHARRFRATLARFLRRNAHGAPNRAPVLIWDMGNFPGIVARHGLFATALKARGERTHTVLCDGTPVACIQRGIEKPEQPADWASTCAACFRGARETADKYCLDYSTAGEYIGEPQRTGFRRIADTLPVEEIETHVYLGANVGRMAWSSLNRHMKGTLVEDGNLDAEQIRIYRMYLYAALVNAHVAHEAIRLRTPSSVVTSHGVYVDFAPAMSMACQRGLPAISWSSAYADGHHYFTVPKGANQLLLQGVSRPGLWEERASTPLTEAEERRLEAFLHHRYFRAGARDINILSSPEDRGALRARLGLRPGRPVFCLFPHVNWDACFDMSSMIYPNANAWTLDTVQHIATDDSVDWIVRIHPGELTDGSVLSTGDLIKARFPSLPPHVKVLWADSDVNSYGLYRLIDGGISIFGTVGVELAAMGKPVVLAGQAHYGGKGFTLDASSISEYHAMLGRAASTGPLSEEQTALARRYAYWYFVQRHIPVRAIDLKQGHWGDLDLERLDSLLPGRDPIMDVICSNVVHGRDFVLPTEMLSPAPMDRPL